MTNRPGRDLDDANAGEVSKRRVRRQRIGKGIPALKEDACGCVPMVDFTCVNWRSIILLWHPIPHGLRQAQASPGGGEEGRLGGAFLPFQSGDSSFPQSTLIRRSPTHGFLVPPSFCIEEFPSLPDGTAPRRIIPTIHFRRHGGKPGQGSVWGGAVLADGWTSMERSASPGSRSGSPVIQGRQMFGQAEGNNPG